MGKDFDIYSIQTNKQIKQLKYQVALRVMCMGKDFDDLPPAFRQVQQCFLYIDKMIKILEGSNKIIAWSTKMMRMVANT